MISPRSDPDGWSAKTGTVISGSENAAPPSRGRAKQSTCLPTISSRGGRPIVSTSLVGTQLCPRNAS